MRTCDLREGLQIACNGSFGNGRAYPFDFNEKKPICIVADGVCLVDDVGGIHGFVDMLEDLHGKDVDVAEAVRAWAKEMGWTGRAVKPFSML